MSDAKTLMIGMCDDVTRSPYAIAPERYDDLHNDVLGKEWPVIFCDGGANFTADPEGKEIRVSFAALLSLWAIAHAAVLIGNEAMPATRAGQRTLDATPGTPIALAIELIDAARDLIRNPIANWPTHLPTPQPDALEGSRGWDTNNLFLGSAGWVLLHETAHIHLQHEESTTADLRKSQEHDADHWATKWLFERVGEGRNREFRIFATATALVWIGMIDQIRRGSTTHPHASERFIKCAQQSRAKELSPGVELASYIIKAVFDPTTETPAVDSPEDAFHGVLMSYSRQPR